MWKGGGGGGSGGNFKSHNSENDTAESEASMAYDLPSESRHFLSHHIESDPQIVPNLESCLQTMFDSVL